MLQHVLRANALSCALFGALFVFLGPTTVEFVGTPPVLLVQVLGAGLLINAAALIWTSMREQPDKFSVMAFALGDLIWVLATLAILIGGVWITTLSGIVSAVCVAVFVGACGLMQWRLMPN